LVEVFLVEVWINWTESDTNKNPHQG